MRWPWAGKLLWGTFALAHLALAGSELLAPHDPRTQRRDLPLAPATELRLVDPRGEAHWRPFIHPWRSSEAEPNTYRENRDQALPLRFFVPAPGNRLWGLVPCPVRLVDTEPPGELYLLGTDGLGRDLWARLLHGGRLSLATALLSTLLALAIGAGAGVLAGYSEGWVGRLVVWGAHLCLCLPWLYLLLAIRGALPLDLPAATAWVTVSLVLGFAGWGRTALLVRATIAGSRRQDYVLAAVGLGLTPWQVMWRHVLPSSHALLLTQAAVLLPRFVIAEVTLSFLGVGISEPQPSWGNLLAALMRVEEWRQHPWLLAPAVALVLMNLGYQQLADRLSATRSEV